MRQVKATEVVERVEASGSATQAKSSNQGSAPRVAAPLTQTGVSLAAGGKCAACGAEMEADQRYCLECGERRGPSRLPVMNGSAQHKSEVGRAAKKSRFSPSTAWIAGVATLLIAIGTGVLIGRSGDLSSSKGSGVQVVTAPTGGTATTSTTASANTPASNSGGKSGGGSGALAGTQPSSSEGTATQALPPPTVTVGQPGHGAGYTNGKFTGNFFGGGQ